MFALGQIALLALRALTGLVFAWSGFSHARNPEGSSKDLGLPKGFVLLLGVVELLAGLSVAGGLLTRLSAIGLMIVMLGAMHRKAFVWHSGFWGKNAMGWHYDLLFFIICLLMLTHFRHQRRRMDDRPAAVRRQRGVLVHFLR